MPRKLKDKLPGTHRKLSPYTQTILIMIIIMVSVSAYMIWRHVKNRTPEFEEVVMCKECGHVFIVSHSLNEKAPYVCKKCGKKSAYKVFHCKNCDVYFASDPPTPGLDFICPQCKSNQIEDVNDINKIPVLQK